MEFASFLNKYAVEWVYFCGDNQEKWSMVVLNLGCAQKMKFGYHWDEFCQSQQFKSGDMIRFKFKISNHHVKKRCHVYQIV
jgi:hypothetical protein